MHDQAWLPVSNALWYNTQWLNHQIQLQSADSNNIYNEFDRTHNKKHNEKTLQDLPFVWPWFESLKVYNKLAMCEFLIDFMQKSNCYMDAVSHAKTFELLEVLSTLLQHHWF